MDIAPLDLNNLTTRNMPLVKAMVISESGGLDSNAQEPTEERSTDIFRNAGVISPPYDPLSLAQICENSSSLRPNIDAYVTNIDSYGHTFKPIINLDAPDANDRVKDALRYENKKEPTSSQVTSAVGKLRKDMANERQLLEAFFDNCTYDMQFSGPEGLRGLTRMDLEVSGNGYWEVLRNGLGQVAVFNRLPAISMRMTRMDPRRVTVKDKRKTSLLGVEEVEVEKRFRRFVQRYDANSDNVFFKEFGDPRIISTKTGKAFDTIELMLKDEPDAKEATEVLYFKVTSPRSEYGIPRWIGVLLAVLGTRQAEEVNFMYFENKSIPPLAVLVNGGRLTADTVKRLEDFIDNNVRGKKNFHKILILEADSAMTTQFAMSSGDTDAGKMRITLQPLTDAQQKDGLFLQYDQLNMDKVGMSFRLPRLLRGDVRDFNRSTAVAALDFAEVQVFNPLRQQFDWIMNRLILNVLDAKYHSFVSNSATITDPEALSKMIKDLSEANILTPEEGRDLAEQVFHREFLKIDATWTQQPVGITVSGANAALSNGKGGQGEAAGPLSIQGAGSTQASVGAGRTGKADIAREKIHALMIEQEKAALANAEVEYIKVPMEIFKTLADWAVC